MRKIADTHLLPEDTAPERLVRHLAQSRVLLNLLKNELRPVTHLLERLAAFGPEAPLDADILGDVSLSQLTAAHFRGLIFLLPSAADAERVVLPREYTLMREIRRPPTTDLVSGLRILSMDHARLMARPLEVSEPSSSPLLLADIHARLLDHAGARAASLPEEERCVLDALLERGGVMDAGTFHLEHPLTASSTAMGPFKVADLFGVGRARGRPTPAQRLFRKGLLFAATDQDAPGGILIRVFVPGELVSRISGDWAQRKAREETAVRGRARLEEEPASPRGATPDVRADLRAFALAVDALGFGFIRAGEARRDHTEAVSRLRPLEDRDQKMLAQLGQILGIFRISGNRLVLESEAARILDEPPVPFRERLTEAVTREAGQADPLRPRMRRLVLAGLRRFPGEWLRFNALPDLLGLEPEFRRTLLTHGLDRGLVETDLLDILEEFRFWGFLDLAGDRGKVLGVRFRPPPGPPAIEIQDKPLTLPPNLEVVVPLEAPFDVLVQLGRFADPKVLDLAAVFSLSEASLVRASSRGCPPGEVRTFLAAHCNHDLPPVVIQLIEDVADREGEVRIWKVGGVMTLQDTDLAEAFQDHPEVGPMILTSLAPGVFALHPDVIPEEVEKLLRKHGFFATLA